jgi:hypothetical protein
LAAALTSLMNFFSPVAKPTAASFFPHFEERASASRNFWWNFRRHFLYREAGGYLKLSN